LNCKGRHTLSQPGAVSCFFFVVRREKTHDKDYLPCVVRRSARQRAFTVQNATVCPLSCAPTKTHGKEFVVRFMAFAVRPWRTAKPLFPVVSAAVQSRGCRAALPKEVRNSSLGSRSFAHCKVHARRRLSLILPVVCKSRTCCARSTCSGCGRRCSVELGGRTFPSLRSW
jgi:hypothetical protein